MAFEFKLPDIGEGVHEGEIAKWLVKEGDSISEDQPMVEVMTDKVTVEITSPVAGIVGPLKFKDGDLVKVGQVIISIEESSGASTSTQLDTNKAVESAQGIDSVAQDISNAFQPAASENKETSVATASVPTYGSQNASQGNGSSGTAVLTPVQTSAGKPLAAPAVRKLARTMGVDLATVSGSGPSGRIRKPDLQNLSSLSKAPTQFAPTQTDTTIPYLGMRRKIGDHLVHSKHTAPHFTYVEEVDMTAIVAMREDLAPIFADQGIKMTYLPYFIKAFVEGLKKFPKLNSTLDEANQQIVMKYDYNIGVAVAAADGLLVPVIKQAQNKSMGELALEVKSLSDKAKNNKLAVSDLQGGTFTLTSIGSIGGIFSVPIINYPEVAIVGIQKIEKRPVVRNNEIVIREMTYLSISCDHRVVDGAEAAMFMRAVIELLEHPARLLI